jgi:hypothetical protein
MHGSIDKSPQADQSIYRSWNIKLIALPVLFVIALIGYAVSHPGVSRWLSEAAQAELFGTDLGPDLALPTQFAQPSNQIHSVLAQ